MPRASAKGTRRRHRREKVLITRTVLCSLGGISEGELAVWEREEFLAPARIERTDGASEALYDRAALERIRIIRSLERDLEVNLPGIGVVLHLLDRLSR